MIATEANAVTTGTPKVLRVYHSAVVTGWRARDRALRGSGAEVELVSAACWNEGGNRVELDAAGDTFVISARTWGKRPNLFVYDPRPIWRSLRRRPVDIIDVHEEPCSLAAAELRLLRRLLRPSAKLLLYSAQNIFKRYPWPFHALERSALKEASAVYVCNEEAGRVLRRKGFRGQVTVLPLGVDIGRFAPASKNEATTTMLRIGYVGRLEERKGVQVVLDAIRDEPGCQLEIVGDGEHAGKLQEQTAELGARVRFRGYVSNAELPELYRSFDVLVVPSLPTPSWDEQFCRVAVEAMASGVPVLASATGALPEVVGGGGLLFPPGDARALRSLIRLLASDGAGRRALAERARARSARFGWEAVAAGHRAVYDAVLR